MNTMLQGFWQQLKKPVIGLSPMDGVTDAAFRFITAKYGKPDVHITEFTSAEGLAAGATKLLDDFIYDEIERPIVAQIFGSSPEAFYKAAVLVCALGFDGLDINMGCPARSVSEHGGGAALIKTPKLAQELIKAAKRGVKAWAEGISLQEGGIHPDIILNIKYLIANKNLTRQPHPDRYSVIGDWVLDIGYSRKREQIPVSVKTRIGYDAVVIEDWVKHLLETEPAAISIHGRTLQQLYGGQADWEAIGRAAKIIKQTSTLVMGNGDIKDLADAQLKIQQYGVDGVLIGRASFGNPWVFKSRMASVREKLDVAIEHAQYFEKLLPNKSFLHMRKHLAWYASGFDGARELRMQLMQPDIESSAAVGRVCGAFVHHPHHAGASPAPDVVY